MKSRLYHFMAFEQMLHCALVTAHLRMSILDLLLDIYIFAESVGLFACGQCIT